MLSKCSTQNIFSLQITGTTTSQSTCTFTASSVSADFFRNTGFYIPSPEIMSTSLCKRLCSLRQINRISKWDFFWNRFFSLLWNIKKGCLGTLWKRFSWRLRGTLKTKLDVILDAHTASAFVLTEKPHLAACQKLRSKIAKFKSTVSYCYLEVSAIHIFLQSPVTGHPSAVRKHQPWKSLSSSAANSTVV